MAQAIDLYVGLVAKACGLVRAHRGGCAMDDRRQAELFASALEQAWEAWRTQAAYTWKRYKPMIRTYGAVGTVKRTVVKPGISPGFAKLRDAGCLDLTMEALVLDARFVGLFTIHEQAAAQNRLEATGWRAR
jgi:hypothetical protein